MEQIAVYPELKRLKAENEELKRKNEDLEERLAIASPDVVHCKDCKRLGDSLYCPLASEGISKADNWFCADGELKEETNND